MINVFRGEYFFLSNFFNSPVEYEGITYGCVEAAFQAQKTMKDTERQKFVGIDGKAAKRLGRTVSLRADWESVKVGIMLDILREKFRDPLLKEKLLATGEEKLVEGNYWGDTFWGVDSRRGGKNMLGKLLMRVRDEIKKIADIRQKLLSGMSVAMNGETFEEFAAEEVQTITEDGIQFIMPQDYKFIPGERYKVTLESIMPALNSLVVWAEIIDDEE